MCEPQTGIDILFINKGEEEQCWLSKQRCAAALFPLKACRLQGSLHGFTLEASRVASIDKAMGTTHLVQQATRPAACAKSAGEKCAGEAGAGAESVRKLWRKPVENAERHTLVETTFTWSRASTQKKKPVLFSPSSLCLFFLESNFCEALVWDIEFSRVVSGGRTLFGNEFRDLGRGCSRGSRVDPGRVGQRARGPEGLGHPLSSSTNEHCLFPKLATQPDMFTLCLCACCILPLASLDHMPMNLPVLNPLWRCCFLILDPLGEAVPQTLGQL